MSALFVLIFALADPHLHGVVRDSAEATPLRGATIRIVGTRLGAVTGADGLFHIHDVRADSVTLRVSMLGYATQSRRVAVSNDDEIVFDLCQSDLHAHDVDVVESRRSDISQPWQTQTILSAQELETSRGQTFATALEQVPGVTVMTSGPSVAKPMIHGMTGARMVITQAGVNQEGQQWGQEHAPEIDPFTPSRISVVKGPSGVRLGPNAMGGAISVEPLPLDMTIRTTKGEISTNVFSNNWQGAVGGWVESTRLFDAPVSARVQASARKAGDARTPDYVLGNTAFEAWSTGASIAVGNADLGVDLYGSMYSTDLGVYAGAHLGNAEDLRRAIERGEPSITYDFSYEIGRPMQAVDHTLLSLQGHWRVSDEARILLRYGWQQNDRSEYDAHNTRVVGRGDDPVERAQDSIARLEKALSTPAMNLLLTSYSLDGEVEHVLSSNVRGSAGVSSIRQVNDRTGSVYLVPDYLAYGVGAWAYETVSFETWSFGGGLRYDRRWLDATVTSRASNASVVQNKIYDGVSASLGAVVEVASDVKLNGNIGLAWRPPQVNELYANDVHHGVAQYEIGDSTLVPERSIGTDIGFTWAIPDVEVELSIYGTWFSNYIYSLPDPENPTVTVRGTFPTYRFTQNDAFIGGVDLSASFTFSDMFGAYLKGAIVRGTNTETSEPLFMMPADRLRVGMHLHTHDVWVVHESYVDVSVLGVAEQSRYVPEQDYAPPPPGYVLCDVSIGGMIHIGEQLARLSISVVNVFNTAYRDYLSRYRYFADDPGRDVILRFTLPIGS